MPPESGGGGARPAPGPGRPTGWRRSGGRPRTSLAPPRSSEAPRHVVFCQLLFRVGEDIDRVADLDEVAGAILAHREEGRLVGHPRRLLPVVGHVDDRVLLTTLRDQLLDPERCNG